MFEEGRYSRPPRLPKVPLAARFYTLTNIGESLSAARRVARRPIAKI